MLYERSQRPKVTVHDFIYIKHPKRGKSIEMEERLAAVNSKEKVGISPSWYSVLI
jgi:hypothetical protein